MHTLSDPGLGQRPWQSLEQHAKTGRAMIEMDPQ